MRKSSVNQHLIEIYEIEIEGRRNGYSFETNEDKAVRIKRINRLAVHFNFILSTSPAFTLQQAIFLYWHILLWGDGVMEGLR